MLRWSPLVFCSALLGCHPLPAVGIPRVPPAPGPSPVELWVDAMAASSGDGSSRSPFKSLSEAIASAGSEASRIHLRAGLYLGPFRTRGPVQIAGGPSSVLSAENDSAVLLPGSDLELEGATIQGGAVGIESAGVVRLTRVRFSGQRRAALVQRGGFLVAEETHFSASLSETKAVALQGNARALFLRCEFAGPYQRALEVRSTGRVEVADSSFQGPVTGIHQVGGDVQVRRSSFAGGRGPAVFSAQGLLNISEVNVHGHEYGLQCGEGSVVNVRGFLSNRSDRAGIAVARGKAILEEVLILDSGSLGGVQLVASDVHLRRFWIHRAEAYGISARAGSLTASDGSITEVSDRGGSSGDALHLRGGVAIIESVSVRAAAGSGVLAAEGAQVAIRDLALEDCRLAGVIAETLARVRAQSLFVRHTGSAAIVVPGDAEVRVDLLRSENNSQGAVWAECDAGAHVVLTRPGGDSIGGAGSRCVRVPASLDR